MSFDLVEIPLSEGTILTVGHNYPESLRETRILNDVVYLEVTDAAFDGGVAALTPEEAQKLIYELENLITHYETA